MANNNQAQQDLAAALTNIGNAIASITQQQQAIANQLAQLQPQQQVVTFHTLPAGKDTTALIDFALRLGKAIYEESQKGNEPKYNLSKTGLNFFLHNLSLAANRLGCSSGATSVIHYTHTDGAAAKNIITHYGELPLARLQTQSTVFISGAQSATRRAQNNQVMVRYTLASLTEEARESILTYKAEFAIVHQNQEIFSFPLLLKRIVSVPSLDNKQTDTNL